MIEHLICVAYCRDIECYDVFCCIFTEEIKFKVKVGERGCYLQYAITVLQTVVAGGAL